MKDIIYAVFKVLAIAFDKIPFLNKLKGYRSVLGFVGLAVVYVLKVNGIGSEALMSSLEVGFMGLTALALNAKNNE